MNPSRCLSALLVFVFTASLASAHAPAAVKAEPDKPLIQIAILLDTSSSMDGLINQARTQLWTVVNEFARAKQGGQSPVVQVALYEYGHSRLAAGEGHIRQVLALTDDLDRVSEQLFALTTGGGDEYCGHVIQAATKGLSWSDTPTVYRAIFIAGNEPFTQGSVDYKQSCAAAIARGIIVNTIHCGPQNAGETTGWADGAKLADGRAMNIDQNRAVVAIASPQDAEILKLSAALNTTYIAFGRLGEQSQTRQSAQDALAASAPASAAGADVQRSVAKAQGVYRNSTWDLVDALNDKSVKLETVEAKELPENMRGMTVEQRKAYVDEQAGKRADIQKQIVELNKQRETFVVEKRRAEAAATGAEDTLDAAMLAAVREQLVKQQFEVKD